MLCVAVCVLWVRSFWTTDAVRRFTTFRYVEIASGDGLLRVCVTTFSRPVSHTRGDFHTHYESGPPGDLRRQQPDTSLGRAGFRVEHLHPARSYWLDIFMVPWWAVALVTLVAPAAWVRAARRRRRCCSPWLCVNCGYDLRATPDRCPECGAAAR